MVVSSGCARKAPINNNNQDNKTVSESNTNTDTKPGPAVAESKTDINGSSNKQSSSTYKIKDYYPFKENIKYEYEGKGMEYASFNTWVDYVKENRIQLRINNGGTEIVKVLENKDGELKVIYSSREETYFREDFTSKQPNKNEVLLKEPLVKGTTWTLPDGRKRYISNIDVEISTPSGNYKALEVTTEDKEYKTIDYYALEKGLVKTIFSSKASEVTSSLSKLGANVPLVQDIRFYYPDDNGEKIYSIRQSVSYKTNDITKMAFEKYFKESPKKEQEKLINPNTKIKSLYLSKDNMVYVDFNKEFVSEMNLGSGPEMLVLQSIVNTLGQYYGVESVYITVEGEPYKSGHYSKQKGEPFKVNTKNIVEVKK